MKHGVYDILLVIEGIWGMRRSQTKENLLTCIDIWSALSVQSLRYHRTATY